MSRRRGSGGLLSFFGIATIVLIVMNVIVFFGVQMTDELKIYDINWAENCTKNKYTANVVYNEEYYACPKSATRDGGYDIDYCKKFLMMPAYILTLMAFHSLEKMHLKSLGHL